ncbi:MAG: glutamate racemase, partial [Chloroflexota bacterium]
HRQVEMRSPDPRPVALLDSGVGGLSILREVRCQLPNEDVLYFADQAHVPYGPREADEIRRFARGITRFFLAREAKVIVVACNAASAASLYHLRETFEVPFVGMEPAVKPAAARTNSGVIGVITTEATFQGELFASVVERFAEGLTVVTQVCPDFVTLVEDGQLDTPAVRRAAQAYLGPLVEANVDQLVLGCTHFPFLMPVFADVVGPSVEIVDPGPAVARQVGRVIAESRHSPDHQGEVSYFTSGDPDRFHRLAARLVGEPLGRDQVQGVSWQGEDIVLRG